MRLIHTTNLEMHDFLDFRSAPPYAILSHRWGAPDQEVSYGDYLAGRKRDTRGYLKIRGFCAKALAEQYDYAWVDTCCIDKNNNSELAEALNSMYQWYAHSAICFVYLEDVRRDGKFACRHQWRNSEWWDRGWTLQELLAPRNAVLFDADWIHIGSKRDSLLQAEISHRARIPQKYLKHPEDIHQSSETTRTEDMAYCMLGILNVNMPLLYGEGDKAFLRLQEEFIRHYDDESIFAWTDSTSSAEKSGMLAPAAKCFRDCDTVTVAEDFEEKRPPFAWTSRGLELRIPDIVPRWEFVSRSEPSLKYHDGCNQVQVVLRCRRAGQDARFAIWLRRQSQMTWYRVARGLSDVERPSETIAAAAQVLYVERVYYVPPVVLPVAVADLDKSKPITGVDVSIRALGDSVRGTYLKSKRPPLPSPSVGSFYDEAGESLYGRRSTPLTPDHVPPEWRTPWMIQETERGRDGEHAAKSPVLRTPREVMKARQDRELARKDTKPTMSSSPTTTKAKIAMLVAAGLSGRQQHERNESEEFLHPEEVDQPLECVSGDSHLHGKHKSNSSSLFAGIPQLSRWSEAKPRVWTKDQGDDGSSYSG